VHDGAYYFNNDGIKALLKSMQVPTMVSAPHSYNLAPAELLFAALKATNLNPTQLPQSKEYFMNVVLLVLRRLKDVPASRRLLFWHHCCQHVFRFLGFERL